MQTPIQQNRSKDGLKSRMMLYLDAEMKKEVIRRANQQRKSQQLIVHEALEKVFRQEGKST